MEITVWILKEARRLISEPDHWAKEYYAYDDGHTIQEPGSSRAVCWCALGAILRASGVVDGFDSNPEAEKAAGVLSSVIGHIPSFNDNPKTTHTQVLCAFDAAIERAATLIA